MAGAFPPQPPRRRSGSDPRGRRVSGFRSRGVTPLIAISVQDDMTLINPGHEFAFELDGGPAAGAAARRAVVNGDGDLPSAVRDDVLLLVTELVTNAVRHGGADDDGSVRVELRCWP